MGLINLTLPSDGETIDAADVNTPFGTIATAINGNLDNANIKSGAAIDGSKIADNSIPNTKMINAPLGWTAFANNPNTITYNGNRNYDLVFNSVDLTSSLSPGMKLKLSRTVAAPDQCADLESSSSQYFSKTSPSGMTFTDDFVVSAWVKLESYPGSGYAIASRYNGTSGWIFNVNSAGQVTLTGSSGGATNYRQVYSYASLPLNKWVHIAAQLDMSAATADGVGVSATTCYIMFDGVDVAASTDVNGTSPSSLTQAGNLEIGSANGGLTPFDGKLAQVAIFNAKVTQATMRTYMSQGLSGSETSLISAYSLDNSTNDLNTTNANNLTANGGALATNADSPFANAVSAGTEEYCEINSVTFSTNTTVNVRVPDTCMIPTSGGISNTYYAVGANPYGLPYFTKVLYRAIMGSTFTTSSATDTQVLGMSCPVVIPTNASVRITLQGRAIYNATTNAQAKITIYDGVPGSGTKLFAGLTGGGGFAAGYPYTPSTYTVVVTPTAGSHTFNAGASCGAGTVNFDSGTANEFPTMTVELV